MQANGGLGGLMGHGARSAVLLAVLLAALLATACGNQPKTQRQQAVPEVSTIAVQPVSITVSTELPGRTSAFRIAEIRPQVNGLIQKRLFTEGADVKAGQTLYQIDPAPFQAALDSATAALAKAQANLPSITSKSERYKSLAAAKAVSQQDYDDAAAALAQAKADILYWQAAVQTARINLGYTKVAAPIAGRIGKSNVTVGAIVTAYQPQALATIQQLDPIYVDVPQSTSDLLELKRRLASGSLIRSGQGHNKVKLFLEDGTPYPLEGTLQFRDVSVDPTTGSVILRMIFPNPEGVLLPEMFVRTEITEGVNDHAILIPQQAVSRNPKGSPYALLVGPDNKVALRMITVDRAVGDKWLVSAGLAPGDRVIVEGLQKVRPGAPAKPVPYKPAPADWSK
jgi:membrane fusion protein (multidrug efflux system)